MIIHVNKKYFARGKTGKGKFTGRLVREWREKGIEVTEDSKAEADVALHIGRMNYKSNARKNVLRVGPACIDTNMDWKKINKEKAKSVKKADAIVYQSRYSKKIYHKLVGKLKKPEAVIFNGADPRDYEVDKASIMGPYTYNFLASTRVWLKQKRLKQIVRSFLLADVKESCLFVCGDIKDFNKDRYKNRNIKFLGNVSEYTLATLYKGCDAMIHLTWVDACPNSVVEAQVAGCPVICTDQGGTHELVEYGKILKEHSFQYKPVDLKNPPVVASEKIVISINQVINKGLSIGDVKKLYIQNIAQQYLTFFEGIL